MLPADPRSQRSCFQSVFSKSFNNLPSSYEKRLKLICYDCILINSYPQSQREFSSRARSCG